MRSGLTLFGIGWLAVLSGGLIAHLIQSAGGVRVEDVRFEGANGTHLSALLYVPKSATPSTPAPGVLAVHGYINSRETQSAFAIEYARRGYVVLALDQTGHGYSGGAAFSIGYGGPDALKYLRSLEYVDAANIGLEGHSMGGGAILAAARAMPDAYRSMVLEGSATATLFSPPGDAKFPRNLAVVFSKYDEFSELMWGVRRAADVASSPKLMALAASLTPLVPGEIHGSIEAGDARVLHTPATTHPGDHFSVEAVGDSLDWFAKTLKGGQPLERSDQIWVWKEFGTLIALGGCVLIMLGTFELLLGMSVFAQIAHLGTAYRERDGKWWLAFALTIVLPPLTFYPFLSLGRTALPASSYLPQGITNQIATWAVLNGLITLALGAALRDRPVGARPQWARAAVVALASVASGYVALLVADLLFEVDFRFWVVALKLLSGDRLGAFIVYLIPFTLFFLVAFRSLQSLIAVKGDSDTRQYWTGLAALALGFALFLLVQYLPLFTQGHLLLPSQALNAIISIQFLPLMAILALILVFTWRRTNSYVPGAFVAGLFVTWYIVAGTAMHVASG